MAAEKYVGRVGGLAVALGIGVALATGVGTCTAWADTTGGSGTSSASDSASPSHSKAASAAGDKAARHNPSGKRRAKVDADGDSARTVQRRISSAVADDTASASALTRNKSAAPSAAPASSRLSRVQADPAPDPAPAPELPAVVIAKLTDPNPAKMPRSAPGPASPIQTTAMTVALAAVRDERERVSLKRTNIAAPQAVSLLADSSPNVLVIGVDGTNLARVLANPANTNFFKLMQGGTTAAASIAGHTTISNPSWTAILTGAWGEQTGVVNNIFNPATYDRWPTVFNQLEALPSGVVTTAIADWDLIAGIAASGSTRADHITFVPQVAGDTDWLLTDDAVGDATELAIAAANPNAPNFVFSYFVGVDENGHAYGGASQQYADAITNFDRNLGEILDKVNTWEATNHEQWTIIMVTDHGHQPQQGVGHGFQSPDETSTFVVANNPDIFAEGGINPRYQIVDVTPTVVTLFGGTPAAKSDGVSITTLGSHTVFPINDDAALRGAVQDAINMYGYPDIATNLTLSVRTIATTVPYLVNQLTTSITSTLQTIADQDIFLISPLAQLMIIPVKIVGNSVYAATNIVAQIIARLTGVTGASIFPLFPPDLPPLVGTGDQIAPPTLLCVVAVTSGGSCGPQSVAV